MTELGFDEELGASTSWEDDGEEGFRVDFSEKEATAAAFEQTIIPAGWYRIAVTDVDLEQVKGGKNIGKPMFNFKHTIQDGPHKGRSLYGRLCLWTGALYSISMAMQAVGLDPKSGRIPPAGFWQGQIMLAQFKVVNKKVKDDQGEYVVDKDEHGKPIKTNEIGGYKSVPDDWDPDKASPAATGAKKANNALDSFAP